MKGNSAVAKEVQFIGRIADKLIAAKPDVREKVAIDLAIEIVDLYEVSAQHRQTVRELLRVRGRQANRRVWNLLQDIEGSLIFDAAWHIKELKKALKHYGIEAIPRRKVSAK